MTLTTGRSSSGLHNYWKATYREDTLDNRVYTDPHTTNRYRVNGDI